MKHKYSFLRLLPVAAGCFSLCCCYDSDDVGDNYTTFTDQLIVDYLDENADQFSEFTRLMEKAEVYSLMKTYGKYTLFLPTNEAMEAYYRDKPLDPDTLSEKELKKFVYYHIIDGESNNTQTYTTEDFEVGAIETKNMTSRYLYTSYSVPTWRVNDQADIISADNEFVNGVVHVIDYALEGNNDLLCDYIANLGPYAIYAEAVTATGINSKMALIEDDDYEQETSLPTGADSRAVYPETRRYGWTALLEPDSVLALVDDEYSRAAGLTDGIQSVDDMEAYARAVYSELLDNGSMLDVDLSVDDRTDERNALNHFVAYHFLKAQVTTDHFVTTYGYISEFDWFDRKDELCYDGDYTIEQYWPTMASGALIQCQKNNIINTTRNPFTESGLANSDEVIHFITSMSNKECQNGIVHALNRVMAYNLDMEGEVLHRRLRMEFRTFLPELVTNDVVSYVNRYNQWHRIIPGDYCANMQYEEESTVYMIYHAANVHTYLYGDEMQMTGFFDLTMTVGPVPAGKYEVRLGYKCNTSGGGVTQIYLDGEPCGIPLDTRVDALDGDVGWKQDWQFIQDYDPSNRCASGSENTGEDDPYGLENDKVIHNHGYMKGPDSFIGTHWWNDYVQPSATGRNDPEVLRRLLGTYTFTGNGEHTMRFVQMLEGEFLFDYIEFVPYDLLDTEDQH